MIKANDILAEVSKAQARRDEVNDHFLMLPQFLRNEHHGYVWSLRLDETADVLATYIRRLPEAVKNKQAKAVAKATAYVEQLRNEALLVSKY